MRYLYLRNKVTDKQGCEKTGPMYHLLLLHAHFSIFLNIEVF